MIGCVGASLAMVETWIVIAAEVGCAPERWPFQWLVGAE